MFRRPALLLAAVLAIGQAQAADPAERGLLVDLGGVPDVARVEALKHSDGTDWWLEAGEVLLLVGNTARLRQSVPAQLVLREVDNIRPDRLAVRPRGCIDHRQPLAGRDLLLVGDKWDLVNRPDSFAPAGLDTGQINPHLGLPEFVPVERNSVLARLHRFDRPEGLPPADPAVAHIAGKVDGRRWFETVSQLASWDRSSYSNGLPQARAWIAARFAEAGLRTSEPVFEPPLTPPPPLPLANVIGHARGYAAPDEWVIIGAHYDSRNQNLYSPENTPGADDNASGCAGVIEAARVLSRYRPRRTVLFICYAGEEQGLHGSTAHARALQESGDIGKVKAMLNMDMIGWVGDATLGVNICTRPQSAAGATELLDTLADAMATYAPELQVVTSSVVPSCCCSDHVPYLDRQRPAVHSIHRGGTAYPYYHTSNDTPTNLGPYAQAVGEGIVRGNVAALVQLAGYDLLYAADFED